jgi:DNA mismatch repair protein MutS2
MLEGKDLTGFETLARSLEQERRELSTKIARLEKQEAELKQSLSKYQSLASELELKKKDILNRAKEDASRLLRDTNREIEKTIRHIKENKAEKKETLRVRKNLETLTQRVATPQHKDDPSPSVPLKEGDRVRIVGQEGSGTILKIQGKTATVQFGLIKSVTRLNRLEKITAAVEKEIASRLRNAGINVMEKRANFNPTLDVRGKRVEEVTGILDQYVDTAILLGQGELRILHGKGEGVLRKVVRDHLKRYKEVSSVSDEHVERGGDGITVVVLK